MKERSSGVGPASWLREPLLHFLVLGVALFVLFQVASGPGQPGDDELVVTVGQIDHIVEIFSKVRQRPPSHEELDGLIDDHILEEVLYREAVAMGLDENDTIIRRRLRQKLEFLVDDFAATQPDDEQLLAFLEENPGLYRDDSTISFEHVFFQQDAEEEAAELLTGLRGGALIDVSTAGDSLPLPRRFDVATESDVSALFGDPFRENLFGREMGSWTGPIVSPFGLHLVFVSERIKSRIPELSEIRDTVERDWLSARRRTAQETLFDQLRSRYEITVELTEWVGNTGADMANATMPQ